MINGNPKINFDNIFGATLNNWKLITIQKSPLKLNSKSFNKCTQLEQISIIKCDVTTIPSNIFSSLKYLKILFLENNKISILEANSLKFLDSNSEISEITLNDNLIDSNNLDKSGLADNKQTIIVGLYNNTIANFSAKFFQKYIDNKIQIYFNDNSINCNPDDLKWLQSNEEKLKDKFINAKCSNNQDIFAYSRSLTTIPVTVRTTPQHHQK